VKWRSLRWLRRRSGPEPTTEAQQARRTAQQGQREAAQQLRTDLARGPEINRVTDSLRRAHLRNHLSESMEHLIVKGRFQ
jgi:hypothetical protein